MNLTFPDRARSLTTLIIGGLIAAGLFAQPTVAAPVLLDRIVAVVNNSAITASELDQLVLKTEAQLAKRNTAAPARAVLAKQLLERMITERVLLQTAEDTNVRIDSAVVDRTIERIAKQNNMDLAAFRSALERDGVDFAGFRQQIRDEMTIVRLREREVDNRIAITDAEIDSYLATHKQEPDAQTEYHLGHLLILAPEAASPGQLAKLRAKADKAVAELRAGTSFAQVSAAYSDAQNALQGGDMGWRGTAKLPDLFSDAVKNLQVGDITPVLRSANGFHILKLNDKRGVETGLVVNQTKARHILIKVNEVVSEPDAHVRLLELRDRLINGGADFANLAKLHSADLSASKGGDLGWLSPGETVPEFERAMNALDIGGVSEPIRSPFGLHLIQVLERRNQDVSQERLRMEARRALRERKAEETYEDWVRQTRDRAYVEYRLEEQ